MDNGIYLNKNDYSILELIIATECVSPWRSLTTKFIIEYTGLSHVKVRQVLKTFILLKYVSEGAKDGNNKTFYATKEGIEHYKEVFRYDDIDIEDLIENYKEEIEKRENNINKGDN